MSSQAQFWQTLRPIRKVGKLRGIIEIPTFTAACGPANYSLQGVQSNLASVVAPAGLYPTAAMTIEAWIMIPAGGINLYTYIARLNDQQFLVNLNGGIRVVFKNNAPATITFDSVVRLNRSKWNHVAVTFDGANIRLYINFILDSTVACANPLTAGGPGNLFNILNTGNDSNVVNINEFRIWNVARTQQQIINAAHGPRDISGVIDVGLVGYWPLNEGVGTIIPNRIAAYPVSPVISNPNGTTPISTSFWKWDLMNSYPYKLGASFFPIVFPIDTSGKSFSLKSPVKKPYVGVNFVPCIRWIDPTDGVTVKRYRLWDGPKEFDVSPYPPPYAGQRIPSVAYLEIWNFDGNSTVDLTSVVDLETSILHVVAAADETTQTADAVVTGNTKVAEAFPLTPFPLVFDDQQTF